MPGFITAQTGLSRHRSKDGLDCMPKSEERKLKENRPDRRDYQRTHMQELRDKRREYPAIERWTEDHLRRQIEKGTQMIKEAEQELRRRAALD